MKYLEESEIDELIRNTVEPNIGISLEYSEKHLEAYITTETAEFLSVGETADRLIDELEPKDFKLKVDYEPSERRYMLSIREPSE